MTSTAPAAILCIADGSDPNLLKSSYYYDGNSTRRAHDRNDPEVLIILVRPRPPGSADGGQYDGTNEVAKTANSYTYTRSGNFTTPQMRAWLTLQIHRQWYDEEIDQYHLQYMYDPIMMRFTGGIPCEDRNEPLTLQVRYCVNDPVNRMDLTVN